MATGMASASEAERRNTLKQMTPAKNVLVSQIMRIRRLVRRPKMSYPSSYSSTPPEMQKVALDAIRREPQKKAAD